MRENTPPLVDMLLRQSGRLRLHMPGHKGRAMWNASPFELDRTELPCTDDLFAPTGAICDAQRALARSAHASRSFMLVGGGTAGIRAMLLYACKPGSRVIMPRNIHHAAISACMMGDIHPFWVWPDLFINDCPHFSPDAFVRAIHACPQASAVLVTRPDYYGRTVDLTDIVGAAHAKGMAVLVDEAHGAHFNWWDTLQNAGTQGADLWVQSAHKTLPALTPGAWLHCRTAPEDARLLGWLRFAQTSSPSFLTLASLDQARHWMDAHGGAALARLAESLTDLRASLPEGMADAHAAWAKCVACDPTRLVIDCAARGYTGWEAASLLAAQGIDVEMADHRRLVAICTVADTEETWFALANALRMIPQRVPSEVRWPMPPLPAAPACSIRDAMMAGQAWVPLVEAVGQVAAASVGVYPPGIPWVVPGERLDQGTLAALLDTQALGGQLFGVWQGQFPCMVE